MTDIKGGVKTRGCVFYDADCPLCVDLARRLSGILARREFDLAPLQSPEASLRLNREVNDPVTEMRLATPDGRIFGGADAIVELARHYWWASPIVLAARFRVGRMILTKGYRWIADRRRCGEGVCQHNSKRKSANYSLAGRAGRIGVIPFVLLPIASYLSLRNSPAWLLMCGMALALGCSLKWLTWLDAARAGDVHSTGRVAAYFLAWPGMDASAFLDRSRCVNVAGKREVVLAVSKTLVGAILIWCAARLPLLSHPKLAGWLGMIGLILFLHFGVFHLVSCLWRCAGVDAQPIMRAPLKADSLAEFWSRRWNLAFSGPAQRFLLNPLARRFGASTALMTVFLISGAVHELVISLPARGGFGLPTAYFLVQGAAMSFERSEVGRKWGLGRGWRGKTFTLAITGLPVYWLFHPAFVTRVILPFLSAIDAN